MKNKNDIKIKLLSILCMTLLTIILLFISCRIFFAIINVFIYFTGLVTIFLYTLFIIGIITYLIFKIIIKSNKFNRNDLTIVEILDICISIHLKFNLSLLLINLILLTIYTYL